MLNWFVGAVFLISPFLSWSRATDRVELAELLKGLSCSKELEEILRQEGVKRNWLRVIDSGSGKVYRAPTEKFGQWSELKIDSLQVPTLTIVNSDQFHVFSFNPKHCKAQSNRIATTRNNPFVEKGENALYFSDEMLLKIISEKNVGFIYLWSPGMVYSVKMVERFRSIAKKLNMKMIEVMDPQATLKRFTLIFQHYKVKLATIRNDSVKLSMRNGQTHYPTVFVFGAGKLSHYPIVGVMSEKMIEKELKNEIRRILQDHNH